VRDHSEHADAPVVDLDLTAAAVHVEPGYPSLT
jgi:hypothetical protein